MKKGRFSVKVFVLSLVVIYLTVILGNLFVMDSIQSGWYHSIRPSITPPDYVFQIVWTIVYFLIAASFTLVYAKSDKIQRNRIAMVYLLNLVLNMIWTLIFFGQKLISIALFDMVLIWISTLYLVITLWKEHRSSSWLLIPYLLWITFALIINYMCLGKM